ncbi:MAG TPA: hypothetical protein VFV70_01555 [Hyphomonadaceae bacterium]|nr:hypothetical protein [Hyphomonadaceae bacterium]
MQKANKGLQLSYCDCVTNEAMKEYGSYQESDAHMNFQKAEELGTRCLSAMDAKDMTLPSSAVFDYGRHWSTDEEHKFLVDCSTSSLKQDPGAKDSVFRYCECAMHRLELQFADPKDTPSDRTALMPMGKACLATAARELPK